MKRSFTRFLESTKIPPGGLSATVSKTAWNAALSQVVVCGTEMIDNTDPTNVGRIQGLTDMISNATKMMAD